MKFNPISTLVGLAILDTLVTAANTGIQQREIDTGESESLHRRQLKESGKVLADVVAADGTQTNVAGRDFQERQPADENAAAKALISIMASKATVPVSVVYTTTTLPMTPPKLASPDTTSTSTVTVSARSASA